MLAAHEFEHPHRLVQCSDGSWRLAGAHVVALCSAILWILVSNLMAGCAADDPVIQEYAIASDGDVILLPVKLAGETLHFMLDTGSTCTVYDTSLVSKVGPVEGFSVLNSQRTAVVSCSEAFVGRWPLPRYAFLLDLTLVRQGSGFDVRGVVGMDFLADKILKIDYDAGKLQFLSSVDPTAGREVKLISSANGGLFVPVKLDRTLTEWFLLDTGDIGLGADGMLRPGLRTQLLASGACRPSARSLSVTATGKHRDAGSARINILSIGEFHHEKLNFNDSESVNTLGSEYWLRYVVTLDVRRSRMFLKPSRRFATRTSSDRSGIHFLHIGEQDLIMRVDEQSPAATAGVRSGDVLLSVGTLDARACTPRTVRLAFCRFTKPIPVVVERSGKRLSKLLLPADL